MQMRETVYKVTGLPVEKIALLGDFHNTEYEPILTSLRRNAPFIICISGDICYADIPESGLLVEEQKNIIPFLSGCTSIAPAFLSLGNHDAVFCDEDWEKIRDTGVVILDNEWYQITVGDQKIFIGGLTSHYVLERRASSDTSTYPDRDRERADLSSPDLSWIEPVPEGFKLLLSHQPEYWDQLRNLSVDLCLSAHAHGGQWRIFNHGVFAPGQGFWPRYSKGLYDDRMIVTAGLSNTTRIPRLFNPTEVVYIEKQKY